MASLANDDERLQEGTEITVNKAELDMLIAAMASHLTPWSRTMREASIVKLKTELETIRRDLGWNKLLDT